MTDIKNLLKETLDTLKALKLKETDVVWVGSKDGEFAVSWEKFKKIANVEYDSDFGGPEVAIDLVVVGKDWWLERAEYDGQEWWEFKKQPQQQKNPKPFNRVVSEVTTTIKELNIKKGEYYD